MSQEPRAATGRGPELDRAAVERDPLADPDQPVPAAASPFRAGRTPTVVLHFDLDRGGQVAETDPRMLRRGMAQGVVNYAARYLAGRSASG